MRDSLFGLLVVGILLSAVASADDAKDAAITKDRERIQGTWRVTSLTVNGNKAEDEDAKKITVMNGDDGTWSIRSEGEEISKGTSTFDPTKKPKTIDFTPAEGGGKGTEYLGIYELAKNTRKLCFSQPGHERPSDFASAPGSQHILVAFERVRANPSKSMREEFARLQKLAQPGEEHAQLKKLVGSWRVSMKTGEKSWGFDGEADSSMILRDRFLVIDGHGKTGNRESAFRYTIGFDRRHDEYVIILMDTAGTYHVTARGKPSEQGIRMIGTDDDPQMKKMGLVKKFAFDLDIKGDDEFSITTMYIDTRTKDEKLRPAFTHIFARTESTE